MKEGEVFVTRLSAWAPGMDSPAGWDEWAKGLREITHNTDAPEIPYTEPLFRRRLSRISKMTIQAVHGLLPLGENVKLFFLSFRGELSRQYQINKTLIQDGALMPAAFSLSVFNAPAALASMAFGLKGGYTALYPGKDSFWAGLDTATAALAGDSAGNEIALVYADEMPPPEYEQLLPACPPPLAFGVLLSRTKTPCSVPLSGVQKTDDTPASFLKHIILGGELRVSG